MKKSVGGTGKTTPNRKLVRKSASRQDLRGITDKVMTFFSNTDTKFK